MNFTIFFLIFYLLIQIINGVSVIDLTSVNPNELGVIPGTRVCTGTIGDCSATEEEEGMDSETSRRVLVMQKKYISYDTLKRDLVPCGTPGASYYNCKTGEANPYNRGCEVITRCARGTKS